jgi:glutathione S-transferase
MIELYGMGSPNVVKIYIALEELELQYNVHPVDVFTGKQFDAEFLRLNPMAKVPVITDSEGPGGKPCTLFESGAILLYLAEKTGKTAAEGHGGEIRGHRVDDGTDDHARPDVRAARSLRPLRPCGE